MNRHARQSLVAGVCALVLTIASLWAWSSLRAAHRLAMLAAADLASCRDAAETLAELRRQPSVAGSDELRLSELARVVEDAAAQADVPPASLVRVSPEPARRVGDSPYQERPTQVLLRGVTLRQLTRFLVRITGEGTGLRTTSLRLTAPRDAEAGDRWTVEATLVYLIYSPREAAPLRTADRSP